MGTGARTIAPGSSAGAAPVTATASVAHKGRSSRHCGPRARRAGQQRKSAAPPTQQPSCRPLSQPSLEGLKLKASRQRLHLRRWRLRLSGQRDTALLQRDSSGRRGACSGLLRGLCSQQQVEGDGQHQRRRGRGRREKPPSIGCAAEPQPLRWRLPRQAPLQVQLVIVSCLLNLPRLLSPLDIFPAEERPDMPLNLQWLDESVAAAELKEAVLALLDRQPEDPILFLAA